MLMLEKGFGIGIGLDAVEYQFPGAFSRKTGHGEAVPKILPPQLIQRSIVELDFY